MSPVELAWLAGLLEGEGCFQIRKSGGYKGSVCIALQIKEYHAKNMCSSCYMKQYHKEKTNANFIIGH